MPASPASKRSEKNLSLLERIVSSLKKEHGGKLPAELATHLREIKKLAAILGNPDQQALLHQLTAYGKKRASKTQGRHDPVLESITQHTAAIQHPGESAGLSAKRMLLATLLANNNLRTILLKWATTEDLKNPEKIDPRIKGLFLFFAECYPHSNTDDATIEEGSHAGKIYPAHKK